MHTMRESLLEKEIFNIREDKFNELSAKIFSFQRQNCAVYQKWCDLNVGSSAILPFMPIRFFKDHEVLAQGHKKEMVFESSSTTGTGVSRHYVPYPELYTRSFQTAFRQFYGDPANYCVLALLPSYLERGGSSLVWMADKLIQDGNEGSGFYLHNHTDLLVQISKNEDRGRKTLLIGVTYALLDLAEAYKGPALKNTIVMETGGMKGRRKEITREEVHAKLKSGFGVNAVHSEYGMTELLSQAYSKGDGIFHCPPWMRVEIREIQDPGKVAANGDSGRICITDLANLYSCSFIATDDIGKLHPDGSFEVLGRLDFSDMRGCNLMVG